MRLVWLIDPRNRIVMVWDSFEAARLLTEDELLDGGNVLPGFTTPVRGLLPAREPPGV